MTKRKKYVDELDIELSDENRSGDEDSVVVDANDYVNGIPMDPPPSDIFVVFISLHLLASKYQCFSIECAVVHDSAKVYI